MEKIDNWKKSFVLEESEHFSDAHVSKPDGGFERREPLRISDRRIGVRLKQAGPQDRSRGRINAGGLTPQVPNVWQMSDTCISMFGYPVARREPFAISNSLVGTGFQ